MSNAYLASCIGVSLATACRYKQEAEKAGYIKTKSDFSYIFIGENKATLDHYFTIKYNNMCEGKDNRLRKGKKYLKWVEADLIHCYIKCKKKKY